MVTRKYTVFKFAYDWDDRDVFDIGGNSQIVKVQRAYIDNVTKEYLTVITPLFMDRVITDPIKVDKDDVDMRHIRVCKETVDNPGQESNFKSWIPYAPTEVNHKEHINQIFSYPGVLSGTYYGENREYK